MNQTPQRWFDHLAGLCLTALAAALALYIAAKLVIAVLPVLIGMGIAGVIGWGLWTIHRFRRSRW